MSRNGRKVGLNCTYIGEGGEFKEAMKGQVGTTFSDTNGLDKMGCFLTNVYQDWYYHPAYKKKELKIQTMPAS